MLLFFQGMTAMAALAKFHGAWLQWLRKDSKSCGSSSRLKPGACQVNT
jgi:hypothetical protein